MKQELDELPSKEGNKNLSLPKRYRNNDMPWTRANRWLHSKVGENFESVFSQWVKLEWIPLRFRNYKGFKRHVETDVIIGDDGELYYGDRPVPINGGYAAIVYVNPKNNKIAASKPNKRRDWRKEKRDELAKRFIRIGDHHHYCKIDGIWYEVTLKDHYFITRYDPVNKKFYQEKQNVPKNTPFSDISLACGSFFTSSRGVIVKHEQLNGKKLKTLGLSNDH